MRLTKDYIIEHIRRVKYPFWSLFVIQNYKRIPVMFYQGEDFEEKEPIEAKVEKSVRRLLSVLDDFDAGAVMSIELKTAKTANGSGIVGPLDFVIAEQPPAQPTAPATFQGFTGAPAGFVSEEVLNSRLAGLEVANEKKINEILFKQREKDFEDKVRRERTELNELRKELNDEKKKYNSNTGQAADALVFAIKKIVAELFPGAFPAGASVTANTQQQLAGTPEAEQQQPDAKEIEINKLCNLLYNNPKVTPGEISQLTRGITNHLNKVNQQQTTMTGADGTPDDENDDEEGVKND